MVVIPQSDTANWLPAAPSAELLYLATPISARQASDTSRSGYMKPGTTLSRAVIVMSAGIGGLGSTTTKGKSKGNRSYLAHVIRLPSSGCRQKVCARVVTPQSS